MAIDNPLQPRGGLLDMMGQGDSGFAGWLNPRRNSIINFGAGLIGADSARDAMRGAAQGAAQGRQQDTAYAMLQQEQAEKQRALQEETQQRNATMEFLQRSHPDLAQAVSGGFPIAQAWGEAIRRNNPTGGGSASFSQTPVFFTDADGNQHIGQMSSGGGVLVNGQVMNSLPEGWKITARPDNFSSINLGSGFGTFDPNAGTFTGPQVPISGSPAQNMDVSFGPEGGRVMAPAAGSPEARELEAGKVRAQSAINTLEQKHSVVMGQIDRALQNAGFFTTGLVGNWASAVPGTPAYDLARTLDTIKANIGFEELQTMRDNSPTGGALGQVTERELAFLQSTIANIEQAQSEQQLRENLEALRNYMQMSQQQRRAAFDQQYGGGTPSGPAATGGTPTGTTSSGITWSIE